MPEALNKEGYVLPIVAELAAQANALGEDWPEKAAELIADMFEALERIANMPATGLYGSFRKPCVEVAAAAIAKALGETA